MESELSADKEKTLPSVPLKTYQWEDLRRARSVGGYPWTHLLKPPLEGEITAEDIIRETTPRRSMSRELTRSRTQSPANVEHQRILILDSSPGSSRKHGEEGEDEGVHVPNFSKEVSMDEDDGGSTQPLSMPITRLSGSQASVHLMTPIELPKVNASPKSILKRRVPDKQYIGVTETREKTKCCHPLVNKIKHLADKTLQKLERTDMEKSPVSKRKKNEEAQEIRQLKSSPGAVRRQKFSAIKLGDSDEMSKSMCVDTPPARKKKEHIYEDIEESKQDEENHIQISFVNNENENQKEKYEFRNGSNKENESLSEKKSNASQDPSLVTENISLNSGDHVMEKLHKVDNINNASACYDEEIDQDEPDVDEVFLNQLEENEQKSESPNITITEITDEDADGQGHLTFPPTIPIETSPSPSPQDLAKRRDLKMVDSGWSKPSSDHEYEIIEKPPPNIIYTAPSIDEKPVLIKADDDLSSTTSLERKYLQHASDDDDQIDNKENTDEEKNEGILNAEALQKDLEERYFVNTPSTNSRTECEVSTSQVDSSALEQLPLKRDSRSKNFENMDKKIQQRFKESTGKLKTQAGKLKTKLQNIKANKSSMPEKPKTSQPERSKFKMPERPKFSLPDRRKFSLPDRPKLKKFSFPERPKFTVPELPKFKLPDRPKINFSSLGRKKEAKAKIEATDLHSDVDNVATVDFEAKTYPRLFSKKKKTVIQKTSSSPTLNREETPPPTFTFEQFKKCKEDPSSHATDNKSEGPREYGAIEQDDNNYDNELRNRRHYETTYDFDKLGTDYMDDDHDQINYNDEDVGSNSDVSLPKQEYTPVITEINNDEFFVRPRGISREDIQVREYLNDETRQAFKNPKNVLALMGSSSVVNEDNLYMNDLDIQPDIEAEEGENNGYSNEDLNDRDDGYYTFPPVRPSRAKRKNKDPESMPYIDESEKTSIQFSEVDLGLPDEQSCSKNNINFNLTEIENRIDFIPTTDLHSIHEYANDDVIQYPDNIIQSQTLPMPPKRKKKFGKKDFAHSSLNDFKNVPSTQLWEEPESRHIDDIVVYRTEHEYIIPQRADLVTEHSPLPPRRNRSRSSRGTSLCDDDRTSHGAESLALDTHIALVDDIDSEKDIRHESPGYATVDKAQNFANKDFKRSLSKTPPARRRKSNSSERKYYTVGSTKSIPDRPPRKKSSTSLMTLDSFTKRSLSGDLTQYVEINEPVEAQKDLKSGDIVSKMKDRPLPPPPRPPRESRRSKKYKAPTNELDLTNREEITMSTDVLQRDENVMEIEVSTQTDPLPDDIDFELGMDENLDISMSSSLRDIVDDDSLLTKSQARVIESPVISRPTSRSERSLKLTDSKITELSKPNIGRSSPTVILVEKRVSSPTRINEREEMLTEASLTVHHIDVDESQIPDVPPLPKPRGTTNTTPNKKSVAPPSEERAIERIHETPRDVQLDNLVTQRLQVKDLDVGRLNVSELQANKILVSDIEGMTLQVTELDSKSGHISVNGIDFSQSVIDEIVKKFAEISTNQPQSQGVNNVEHPRPISREEETQTDDPPENKIEAKPFTKVEESQQSTQLPRSASVDEGVMPPQRPPPPDLSPLLYSYLQDITLPSFYAPRQFRERSFTDFHEPQHPTPQPPTRRAKRKPTNPHTESSSDEGRLRPSPRRITPLVKAHEPTIVEAGTQFLRVCHSSISRTLRNVFNSFMAYISGTEDKKDVQMALVIFLVLIAGLIMFGLSDSRAVHHHHWEFFNPPDGKN